MATATLDAVNDMIALLGENPLNSLDEDHPLVASALRVLRVANTREQARVWWFNRERVTLQPDPVTSFINIPVDTISVDPANPRTHLVARGSRLYDPYGAGYTIGRTVTVTLIRNVPFEELPPMAQIYISLCAQLDFGKNYDADRSKTELLLSQRQDAKITLSIEDIRAVNANLLYRPSTLAKFNELGGRGVTQTDPTTSYATTSPVMPIVDSPDVDFEAIFTEAANGG